MSHDAPDAEQRLERVRTALLGLGPEQSESLVRMLELGAMICLVEASADGASGGFRPGVVRSVEPRRARRRTGPHARAS